MLHVRKVVGLRKRFRWHLPDVRASAAGANRLSHSQSGIESQSHARGADESQAQEMITIELHTDRQWKPWCLTVSHGKVCCVFWFRTRHELCLGMPVATADYERRVNDDANEV